MTFPINRIERCFEFEKPYSNRKQSALTSLPNKIPLYHPASVRLIASIANDQDVIFRSSHHLFLHCGNVHGEERNIAHKFFL